MNLKDGDKWLAYKHGQANLMYCIYNLVFANEVLVRWLGQWQIPEAPQIRDEKPLLSTSRHYQLQFDREL